MVHTLWLVPGEHDISAGIPYRWQFGTSYAAPAEPGILRAGFYK
jgi:hypothetical protein